MTEKRRFLRFPISLRTILFTFKDGLEAEVRTDNVSREGIGLEVDSRDLQQGAIVQMHLCLEGNKDQIAFTGKIAWVNSDKDMRKVGIEITQIDPAQKSEILEKAYKIWLREERIKQKGCIYDR